MSTANYYLERQSDIFGFISKFVPSSGNPVVNKEQLQLWGESLPNSGARGFVEVSSRAEDTIMSAPADIILEAKRLLGLPKTKLAKIFDVTRPTLDAHLESNADIQQASLTRYKIIGKILEQLKTIITITPGPATSSFHVKESTLFVELCEDILDEQRILDVAKELNNYLERKTSVAVRYDLENPNRRNINADIHNPG